MKTWLGFVAALILSCPAISFGGSADRTTYGNTEVWKKIVCCNWIKKPKVLHINDTGPFDIDINSKDSKIVVNGQPRPAVILDIPEKSKRFISIKAYFAKGWGNQHYFHPVLVELDNNGKVIGVIDNDMVFGGSPKYRSEIFNEYAKYYINDRAKNIILFGKSDSEKATQNINPNRVVEYYDGKPGDPKITSYKKYSADYGLTLEGNVTLWLSEW